MTGSYDDFHNIRLVSPDDADYIAHQRRMADLRPARGGPRAAGEYLGGIVELAVRHWLSAYIPLQEARILAWEQRLRNGRNGTLYRELDAVWTIDEESLCLYEMKLTYPENMEKGVGIRQLNIAADTLFASKLYRYILKRLVYIGSERVEVLDGIPELEPDDETEELGVIWVTPEAVETSAIALGIELPENWLEPESREGYMEDPQRDEWKQFADSTLSEQAETDNPLADALRRAQGDQSK